VPPPWVFAFRPPTINKIPDLGLTKYGKIRRTYQSITSLPAAAKMLLTMEPAATTLKLATNMELASMKRHAYSCPSTDNDAEEARSCTETSFLHKYMPHIEEERSPCSFPSYRMSQGTTESGRHLARSKEECLFTLIVLRVLIGSFLLRHLYIEPLAYRWPFFVVCSRLQCDGFGSSSSSGSRPR